MTIKGAPLLASTTPILDCSGVFFINCVSSGCDLDLKNTVGSITHLYACILSSMHMCKVMDAFNTFNFGYNIENTLL